MSSYGKTLSDKRKEITMKDFNQYKFADISDQENTKIKQLEYQIKTDTGKEIVLIAYQENSKPKLV